MWSWVEERMSFQSKWAKSQGENVGNKLLGGIKPQPALKPRIEEAQRKLQMQISKLDSMASKVQEKDQAIFKRIVDAMQNHDNQYARALSGELSQIRKMSKMLSSAKLALEQIQIRLNTLTEFGDVVVTLSPAMSVIKGIQGGLKTMMPEADQSFGQISDLLGSVMTDSGQIPDGDILDSSTTIDEDAVKILEEASGIVEEATNDKFPDIPTSSSQQRTTKSNAETSIF